MSFETVDKQNIGKWSVGPDRRVGLAVFSGVEYVHSFNTPCEPLPLGDVVVSELVMLHCYVFIFILGFLLRKLD